MSIPPPSEHSESPPPRTLTPLDYVNPPNSEHAGEPEGPGDPDGPGDGPGDNGGNDDPDGGNPIRDTRFLDALFELSDSLRTLRQPSAPKADKIKVREPDTFDGTTPRKLRDFLISCNLHFRNRAETFSSDEKKIIFILSYLKGSALSWFEPGLNDPTNSAHWIWDYEAFLAELESNFGPHDPIGDAEKALSDLAMKKTARITKYNVDFWELASRVEWNEAALRERYFRGLPLRLRIEVLRGGKPDKLADLRLKAQDADNIYWMQEEETRVETKNTSSTGNSGKKDSKGTQSSSNQSKTTSQYNSNSTSTSKNTTKDKPKNSIAEKLGKDGKLTGEERERRMKEGLCLYCGEKGHMSKDCNKSKTAKARAATTSKADSADSKK
jgi:hypothetical protein